MDEEELVAVIEQPDGSMLDAPVRVARNGGAGPVRSNAQGSKSASASDRAGKFKKQRRAPPKYVRPEKWKLVRRYRTCIRARFDDEDIFFDIYQRARDLMELSFHKMLPGQEPPENGLHLWTLKRKANAVSNGVSIREYACPLRFRYSCRVGLRIVQGGRFIQLERRGLHHINSHVAHKIGDHDQAPDLIDDSDDDADFDDDDDSVDEDDSEDEEESVDEDDCENSSDGIHFNCVLI